MGGEGESAPKRRRITPSPPRSAPVSALSLTLPSTVAPPTPVSDVIPTPEVVQVAAKDVEETVVPALKLLDKVVGETVVEVRRGKQANDGKEKSTVM